MTPRWSRIACYTTIAACLPYITLKVLWLSGQPVGGRTAEGRAELLDQPHRVGNVITLGLVLAEIAVVLAFSYGWGQRIPAVVVLVPIWFGTGLLAPIVLGLPAGLLAQAVAGGSPAPPDNGASGWVFAVVYGGFGVQAAGLIIAFAGYARRRWPTAFSPGRAGGATRGIQQAYASSAVAVAAGFAAVHVLWAVTGRFGAPAGFETVTQRTFVAVSGLLALAGAIGVVGLVRGSGRSWLGSLIFAWTGTAAAFAAGFTGYAAEHPLGRFVAMMGALIGIGSATAGLLALIDRTGSDSPAARCLSRTGRSASASAASAPRTAASSSAA